MEREIGSSYPAHIGYLGPIESFSRYVNVDDLKGIYLRYLLAAVSTKNKVVTLLFDPSLRPYMVRVVTADNEEFADWKLEDYNKDDFIQICVELELEPSEVSMEVFAKKLLKKLAPQDKVPVPAYRLNTGSNA
ncbi:hypothetical protein [Vibrio nigripulchritudo]|uniref:hypothetical protein n=1 Tax=Vibrio nigripulchritudo TaxID=28173 RepID=UPI0003B236C2|nr:hypothetical protein [Vibrio nigripulchritudo]CCN69971.1 hypothetical protein VIBNISFn118_1630002 [Vibrio nigripulchritudo SFn118]